MADLHFLRPLWLLLLLAVPLIIVFQQRLRRGDTGWQRHIPPALLRPLIRTRGSGSASPAARMSWWPPVLTLIVLSLALAGPSWREAPTPLKQPGDSLVVVLDLSLSMLANDVEPDRLTLAKRKIRDILAARRGALTALLVYSGDAHVVTPLTDDQRTIEAMLGVLEPTIMPAQGNRADLAVRQAAELLAQGAPGQGRILLISDAVPERYFAPIRETLTQTPYPLNVLVVGTPSGGPIPLARRGFIREDGEIVIARAEPEQLAQLARANGGQSSEMTLDDQDIRRLALAPEASDEWTDAEGRDQRGPELIEQNPERAAAVLETPGWRGAARYRHGDFAGAADDYSLQPGAAGHYNRGNALARSGQLQEALAAYDKALAEEPEMKDARFNRDLVQQLLDQQQQQQGGENQSSNQDDQNNASEQNQNQQNSNANQDGRGEQDQDSAQGQQQGEQGQQQQDGEASEPTDDASEGGQEDPRSAESQNTGSEAQGGQQSESSQSPAPVSEQPLSQGQEQWLRRIPDNPGGLLQRKFLQQYQQRQTPPDEGDSPW
jgi:Ca-activated chloride channel family protein